MSARSNIDIDLKATDRASKTVTDASRKMSTGLSDVERKSKALDTQNRRTTTSGKDMAVGLSGLATGAFALYQGYDGLNNKQLALDRANLMVSSSVKGVDDAQRRLTNAIEKSGVASEEAERSRRDLAIAEERLAVASQTAEIAQGNVSQAMMSFALSIVPTAITMISSISMLTQSWGGITKGMAAAQRMLNLAMSMNPIMIVVIAIAALVAGLIWAYHNVKPFRDAVDALGAALMAVLGPAIDFIVGGLKWLWEGLSGVGDVLGGLWEAIMDNPILKFLMTPITLIVALIQNWDKVMAGFGETWDKVMGGLKWVYDRTLGPIIDAIISGIEIISEGLGAFGAWLGITPPKTATVAGAQTEPGEVRRVARTGLAVIHEGEDIGRLRPTMGMGEGGGVRLDIKGPLVYIEGSADKRTMDAAISRMKAELSNVIAEPSSLAAPTISKRIRWGASLHR